MTVPNDLTYRTVTISGDSYHVLTGPAGAVTWTIKNDDAHIALHSPTPLWDGHPADPTCPFLEGRCYTDVRFILDAEDYRWDDGPDTGYDSGAINAELTHKYEACLRDNTFIPIDIEAATGHDHTPARLTGEECTQVIKTIHQGDTLHDAIRAAYRARRTRFLNIATATPDIYPEPLRFEAESDLLTEFAPHLPYDQGHDLFARLRAQAEADDQVGVQATLDTLTGVRG